jgi:SAM-dependent methyltransferase
MSAQERPQKPNESPQPAAEIVLASQSKSFQMNGTFGNVYEDEERARAYATLQFPATYYLAFRDLPALIRRYNHGSRALDFGCGTGRSTRFLRNLGLNVIGTDVSQAMLDQARALDSTGEYHLVRDDIAGEFEPGSFDLILAAFTFDNMPTGAKADALSALRTLLASEGCLLLVVSSPAIYVNEWASFSTRDFPENRHARDSDRVRIIMLDVPDHRPVEDVFCTDAHYRRLFESAGFRVLDVQSPLATGKEATRWISETTTAAWTIYVLRSVTLTMARNQLEKCHPADPPGGSRPAGIGGDSFSMSPQMKRQPA